MRMTRIAAVAAGLGALLTAGSVAALDEFDLPPPPPPCADVNQAFEDDGCTDFDSSDVEFCFADRVPDGSDFPNKDGGDNQVFALGNRGQPDVDCGIVLVKQTGYYAIYDEELSESCADQMDETGYLTVHNGCNPEGWGIESNVDDERYLVLDSDNVGAGCEADSDCTAGRVCREGNNHGRCCVPDTPVFMGTFLLIAGEENVICINHWCPEWEEHLANGEDRGYVHDDTDESANCSSPDSIHFKIAATSFVCRQEGYVQPCQSCIDGTCEEHPCFAADCDDDYCVMDGTGDAECRTENPCAFVTCEHGCLFGQCLQARGARGEDGDGDGYSIVADCDDRDADVNPGQAEDMSNGIDDNCDGFIDTSGPGGGDGGVGFGEENLGDGTGTGNGSGSGSGSGGADAEDDGGCGCRIAGRQSEGGFALLVFAAGLLGSRLRRRRR